MLQLLLFLSVALAAAPETHAGKGYRKRPLELPQGFVAASINDAGDVVGNHAENGIMLIQANGDVRILGIPGTVTAINNRGQMVINHEGKTYLRQPDGRLEPRVVPGAESTYGSAINNLGEIAGTGPVIWDANGASHTYPIAVGYVDPNRRFYDGGTASGINDRGTVVGGYTPALIRWGVYRLDDRTFFTALGGGIFGVTAGISNNDDVFYSFISLALPAIGRVQNRWGGALYNGDALYAITPDGSRVLGRGFLLEACTTSVVASSTGVPLSGGSIQFEIEAEPDCEWVGNSKTTIVMRGAGNGIYAAEVPASDKATSFHMTAAGADFVIWQGEPDCEFAFPGSRVWMPPTGGRFQAKLSTKAGCAWTAAGGLGVKVEPDHGDGGVELTVTVDPNPSRLVSFSGVNAGGANFSIYQAGAACDYRLASPPLLGAGSGSTTLEVKTLADCSWAATTDVTWLHLPSRGSTGSDSIAFTFEANGTGSSRTAEVKVGQSSIFLTQSGTNNQGPVLVEPSNTSGPGGVFRFTYVDGPLTAQISQTRIQFGANCLGVYKRGSNSLDFAATGDCKWGRVRAEAANGLLILTAEVSFSARGPLAISADGRQLGIFNATDIAPPRPAVVSPVPVPQEIGFPGALLVSSYRGTGGVFRIAVPKGLLAYPIAFGDDRCMFAADPDSRTIALYEDGGRRGAAVPMGTKVALANGQCVLNAERTSVAVENGRGILDVALMFRSTFSGFKSIRFFTTEPEVGPYFQSLPQGFTVESVERPSALATPTVLRVSFPSSVPIEAARIVFEDCQIEYAGANAWRAAGSCPVTQPAAQTIGNDLVLILSLSKPIRGPIKAAQTPRGGIDSGLLTVGALE